MNDEQRALASERIISLIKGESIAIGQRLPGERRLAELCGSCRNTVREVLKHLEERGYVEIRQRSGCYVVSKEDTPDWKMVRRPQKADMPQMIQAIAIVGPAIAKLATESCTRKEMAGLNQITAQLGQAIVDHVPDRIVRHYARFYALAAELVGNRYLALLMGELERVAGSVDTDTMTVGEDAMGSFFAAHVEMVNAMFRHDPHGAFKQAEESVAVLGRLFAPDLLGHSQSVP
ncbi:FadR/GntR family transcriptional regulator [Desulfoplanes sp.]